MATTINLKVVAASVVAIFFSIFVTKIQTEDLQSLEGLIASNVTVEQYKKLIRQYARSLLDEVGNKSTDLVCARQHNRHQSQQNEEDLLKKKGGFLIHSTDFKTLKDFSSFASLAATTFRQDLELLNVTTQHAAKVNVAHLKSMLEGPLTVPRSHLWDQMHAGLKDKVFKEDVGVYIWQKLGLFTGFNCVQTFLPQVDAWNRLSKTEGNNIIGVFPGSRYGSSEDEISLVIAHWDTVSESPGFDDNGSGTAALLEIARALGSSQCKYDNSIILAALDLEEVGTHGAMAFIHEFLVKKILRPYNFPHIKGVIVLDSIMTYNATPSSQTVSQDWLRSFPDQSQNIIQTGAKGDFAALFSRQEDRHLAELFIHHWNSQEGNEADGLKLRHLQLPHEDINSKFPSNASGLERHSAFLRSDHVRFWIANHQDYYASFHSISLSDTGPSRGIMRKCYHNMCDSALYNASMPFASLEMLQKVTQTTIDMLLDVSNAKCNKPIKRMNPNKIHDYTFWDKRTNSSIVGADPYSTAVTVEPREEEPQQVLQQLQKNVAPQTKKFFFVYFLPHFVPYFFPHYPVYYLG